MLCEVRLHLPGHELGARTRCTDETASLPNNEIFMKVRGQYVPTHTVLQTLFYKVNLPQTTF